jgi:hypothetical protein
VNYIRKTAENDCTPDGSPDFWKEFWIFRDAAKVFFDGGSKFLTQAFAFALISSDGTVILQFRDAAKNEAAFHFRYLASSLALTSSHETTSLGFAKWSCNRRSISSASPGVSSCELAMPSQRSRHSSIRSAHGSARASLKIASELIPAIYRVRSRAQAEFCSRAIRNPQSAIRNSHDPARNP